MFSPGFGVETMGFPWSLGVETVVFFWVWSCFGLEETWLRPWVGVPLKKPPVGWFLGAIPSFLLSTSKFSPGFGRVSGG